MASPSPLQRVTPPLRLVRPNEDVEMIDTGAAFDTISSTLGATTAGVFMTIVRHAPDGICAGLSYADIADASRLSRRHVMRIVGGLVDAGWLELRPQVGRRGDASANVFVLSLGGDKGSDTGSPPSDKGSDTGGDTQSLGGDIGGTIGGESVSGTENESVESGKGGVGGNPSKRSHQLPDDFKVTDEMIEWAIDEEGMTRREIDRETAKFRDHFGGNGEKKISWVKTWKNWMRRRDEFAAAKPKYRSQSDINSPAPGKFVQ